MIRCHGAGSLGFVMRNDKEDCRVHYEDTHPDETPMSAQELKAMEAAAREVGFDDFVQQVEWTEQDVESWISKAPDVSVSPSLYERMRVAARRAVTPELQPTGANSPNDVVVRLLAAASTSTADAAKLLHIPEEKLARHLREPLAILDTALVPHLGDFARHVGVSLRLLLGWLATAADRYFATQCERRLAAPSLSRLDARSASSTPNDGTALVRAARENELAQVRAFFTAATIYANQRASDTRL